MDLFPAMNLKLSLIRRFRGIRQLDWTPGGATICLVGPSDSKKTAILKAVELALSPQWSLQASDTDFFGTATEEPIMFSQTPMARAAAARNFSARSRASSTPSRIVTP